MAWHLLRRHAPGPRYDVRDLLAPDPSRVTLVVMGVRGQKSVWDYSGRVAHGVNALAHFGTAAMTALTIGWVMGRDDESFVVFICG